MIIIIGDSWGVGEWGRDYNISGPGFGQLLLSSTGVINLSIPGGSNHSLLDRLEDLLSRYRPSKDDRFFWVFTCPGRDVSVDFFLSLNGTSMIDSIKSLTQEILKRGDLLAQNYDINIEIIGGLADLNDIDFSDYKNLLVPVPSWGRLLYQGYHQFFFHSIEYWEEVGDLIKNNRPEYFSEWEYISSNMISKHRSWWEMRNNYFSTDGCHPNREAHQILKDFLFPE